MNIQQVFGRFCQQIQCRTEMMTEDNVRYYWMSSMLAQDNDLNHYTLEAPYEAPLQNKELDLYYADAKEAFCFEIKFHRIHGKTAYPHTDAAGALFGDIMRLQHFHGTKKEKMHRMMLYVTDAEMDAYLNKQSDAFRTKLNTLYNLSIGNSCTLTFNNTPSDIRKTFLDNVCQSYPPVSLPLVTPDIRLLCRNDMTGLQCPSFKGQECHIRLYELKTDSKIINPDL